MKRFYQFRSIVSRLECVAYVFQTGRRHQQPGFDCPCQRSSDVGRRVLIGGLTIVYRTNTNPTLLVALNSATGKHDRHIGTQSERKCSISLYEYAPHRVMWLSQSPSILFTRSFKLIVTDLQIQTIQAPLMLQCRSYDDIRSDYLDNGCTWRLEVSSFEGLHGNASRWLDGCRWMNGGQSRLYDRWPERYTGMEKRINFRCKVCRHYSFASPYIITFVYFSILDYFLQLQWLCLCSYPENTNARERRNWRMAKCRG